MPFLRMFMKRLWRMIPFSRGAVIISVWEGHAKKGNVNANQLLFYLGVELT
jgi:hypothetical protein